MDWWVGSGLCLPATILAAFAGYMYGKEEERKRSMSTESGAAMVDIHRQITEIKAKFQEIEKLREEREKQDIESKKKLDIEKDKNWKTITDNHQKNEADRFAQIQQMLGQLSVVQKLLSGTQSRGSSGEQVLKGYLKDFIKNDVIRANVNVGNNMTVEFAWKLKDGKYLPIDSKCHDVLDIIKKIEETESPEEQKALKKKIRDKVERSINEVKKYQNQTKTMRYCIMAVPDQILDLVPETTSYAIENNIYIATYSNVAFISYMIAEQYNCDLEKGDAKALENIVKDLMQLVEEIHQKTDTIEKGIKMVKNANDEICTQVGKAKKIGG